MQKLRNDDGVILGDGADDDDKAWDGWDVESDSSDDESDEEWHDVSDNDKNLVFSDSEDEADCRKPEAPPRISTLATTRVYIFLVFSPL